MKTQTYQTKARAVKAGAGRRASGIAYRASVPGDHPYVKNAGALRKGWN